MRLLPLIGNFQLIKRLSSFSTSDVSWFYTRLTHRSLLRIRGEGGLQFLQGIVTNDTRVLSRSNENRPTALFAMMLNTQGRLLYDLILYVKGDRKSETSIDDEDVYVECDRSVVSEVTKQLQFYRLRRKLELQSMDKDLNVYSLFSKPLVLTYSMPNIGPNEPFLICNDPRVVQLGFRAILATNEDPSNVFQAKETNEDEYHSLRYSLGISEGCGDMPPGAVFPLEANGDYMNGISFHKGCYVGQELTARTHHTGVVRKRLMPLKFETDTSTIRINAPIVNEKGMNVGKFRRASGQYGLGLLYIEQALVSKNLYVQADKGEGIPCRTEKPSWWETTDMKVNGEVRGFHARTADGKQS